MNAGDETSGNIAVVVATGAGDQTDTVGAALNNAINGVASNTIGSTYTNGTNTLALTETRVGNYAIAVDETGMTDAAVVDDSGATSGGTDATGAVTAVQNLGTLTLSSSENFTIGGNNAAYAGLSNSSATLSKLNSVDISSLQGANDAIAVLDGALSQINSIRADLGAIQNRFESTISSLSTTSENLSAARSRIMDTDFAAETASMTRSTILQQAGISILAQANSLPQQVLSLLQ